MDDDLIEANAGKARQLMVRVARRPRFACCCICLSTEDRRRAKRVFRLVRAVERDKDARHGTRRRGKARDHHLWHPGHILERAANILLGRWNR